MKTSKYLSICAMLAAGAFLSACSESMEEFDNEVYVDGATDVTNLLLDGETDETTYTLQAQVPQPADKEITVTYAVDPSLVDTYNMIYGVNTVLLPEEFYTLTETAATIQIGAVSANPVSVQLQNLTNIDPDYIYCLPVTVTNATIPVVASKRSKFFIIRGASLINWVTNLDQNFLRLAGSSPELSGMKQITVEALIRPNANFGDGNDVGISTWIGIESSVLLRFGDASVDPLQLQFACSSNVTSTQWTIEKEKWQFITFTYDANNGQCQFFVDGIQKGETLTSPNRRTVDWNNTNLFFIGKSYSNNRDFSGDMAEVRVWNRILTKEEIQAKNHFYKVDPESEGLVSYWKMNEGAGDRIHDYANGYDLNANSAVTWVPVNLPQ